MKHFLRFAFLAALAVRLFAADGLTSRESLGLVGSVKTVTESDVTDVSRSNPDGEPFNSVTTSFSPDGHVLEVEDCHAPSCEQTVLFWQGSWVLEERHKSDLVIKTVAYVRDSNGQVIEQLTVQDYLNGGGLTTCAKTYRDTELGKEEIQHCDDGVSSSRRVAQPQEESGVDTVFEYRYETASDGDGRWVLDSQSTVVATVLADGSLCKVSSFGKGKSVAVTNTRGQVSEEVHDFSPSYQRMTHLYNPSGREVERAEWEPSGAIINRRTYAYQDDIHGNWTRRTEYFWSPAYNTPVTGQVTVRKIVYY